MELRQCAVQVLCITDPLLKAEKARELQARCATLPIAALAPAAPGALPGRPARPELIHPAKVPRRSPFKPEGLAALLHAIAHIEFNAINLALDAAWRFDGMPAAFYRDWVRVAAEEAYHFTLLREHLQSLGHAYGDFPAHDNLWAMCDRTRERHRRAHGAGAAHAGGARTGRHPARSRTSCAASARPRRCGPWRSWTSSCAEEIGHVAIGNHWYRWLCEREGLDPVAHYGVLVQRYDAPRLYPPFNGPARKQAGFSDEELAWLLGG